MKQQQQPFYPIWEMFVLAVSQPVARQQLNSPNPEPPSSGEKRQNTILIKDLNYHPFNLSSPELNVSRARSLLEMLGAYPRARETLPDWWPRNPTDLIERIKKEREEMDTLGYIASMQPEVVAHSGGEGLREGKLSSSNGKRKRGQ